MFKSVIYCKALCHNFKHSELLESVSISECLKLSQSSSICWWFPVADGLVTDLCSNIIVFYIIMTYLVGNWFI